MPNIKYGIVPLTRGRGIEVTTKPGKTYQHFLKHEAEDADGLDFVFLSEKPTDLHGCVNDAWPRVKVGGYLVSVCDIQMPMLNFPGWDWVADGEFHAYRKRDDGSMVEDKPSRGKSVCVVRYGGFGDQLQAANILPELKRQGYHIAFMTTPKGQEILEHDPHIDEWIIQDDNQVPNPELHEYWRVWARKFDRFINLSESVEGALLAIPGRVNHGWPDSLRRELMGVNYLEFTSRIAELPYSSEARFYPTDEERAAVERYRTKIAKRGEEWLIGMTGRRIFLIVWALAGSSVHKFYPGQDSVIARIMLEMPEAEVVFVGDTACQILEAGWENERRVHCTSGQIGIRETLALAQGADLVIGPETGVLNAVAFESNAKVVLLSHSTHENLTKHWVNTMALMPDTPCYPCHRLHFGRDFCPMHEETGAAICQVSISPEDVFEAIECAYEGWK